MLKSPATDGSSTQPKTRSSPVGGSAPTGTLQQGMTGVSVRLLQTDLVKLGFMTQRQMDTGPGHFGPRTEKALKAFQSAHSLEVDGVYGPSTREALKSALSGTSTPSKPTTKPSTKPTTP